MMPEHCSRVKPTKKIQYKFKHINIVMLWIKAKKKKLL